MTFQPTDQVSVELVRIFLVNEMAGSLDADHLQAGGEIRFVHDEIEEPRIHATVQGTRDGECGDRGRGFEQLVGALCRLGTAPREGSVVAEGRAFHTRLGEGLFYQLDFFFGDRPTRRPVSPGNPRLGGERIYESELRLRQFSGATYDELEKR
jgi:hypothetical protein